MPQFHLLLVDYDRRIAGVSNALVYSRTVVPAVDDDVGNSSGIYFYSFSFRFNQSGIVPFKYSNKRLDSGLLKTTAGTENIMQEEKF